MWCYVHVACCACGGVELLFICVHGIVLWCVLYGVSIGVWTGEMGV